MKAPRGWPQQLWWVWSSDYPWIPLDQPWIPPGRPQILPGPPADPPDWPQEGVGCCGWGRRGVPLGLGRILGVLGLLGEQGSPLRSPHPPCQRSVILGLRVCNPSISLLPPAALIPSGGGPAAAPTLQGRGDSHGEARVPWGPQGWFLETHRGFGSLLLTLKTKPGGVCVWPKSPPKPLQPSPFPKMGSLTQKEQPWPTGCSGITPTGSGSSLRALSDPRNKKQEPPEPLQTHRTSQIHPQKSSSPVGVRKKQEREGKSTFNGGRSSTARP